MLKKKEFDLLVLLSESDGKTSQRELAEKLNCSVGTVNKMLKEFMERGWCNGKTITAGGLDALEPYRVKRAVFLAAGFGSRLVPITLNTPKPLIRVHGKRMIETLLDAVVAAQIPEIIIVRGYLGEQFDQLLYKYPSIKFVENPIFNESNNISSALCVRYMLQNAYVLESDLLLANPALIRKYEYQTNFLGIPVDVSEDWCFKTDAGGYITEHKFGGRSCHQMVGISYWNAEDGAKLADDIATVYHEPGGKERYWEQTALLYKKEHYKVAVRECAFEDVVEIDTFGELKKIDKTYDF
ncbi:MAG: winged helix-turn-helix transcriptional regulator [Ruminococcaceae bacterium]|nr:winged helix-turn-helix transcriptional regulator [Oscillospiraceae bacterium]